MTYWNKTFDSRIKRRRALALIGGSAAATAFLVACGGDEDETSGSTDGTASDGEPKPGGVLRAGLPADLVAVDPHVSARSHRATLWPVAEGLTTYNQDLKVQPLLATEWEQLDGGATLVMKLRPGVTFHTGREVTSEAVRWNFDRAKNPNVPLAQFRLMANWFPTIETPDKYTVILKSQQPRAATFDFFQLFLMTDPVHMEGPNAESAVIGTGPWKWVEWRQGLSLELAKNADYWDKGVPYLDGVKWSLNLDAETLLAQFEAGDLDAILDMSIPGFVRYQKDSKLQALLHPTPGGYYINGFNCRIAPFNDKRVRQAFQWATDRKRFTDLVLQGLVEPYSLPWPKVSAAYNDQQSKRYSLNLDEASKLLRAAGATNINTTVFTRVGQPDVQAFLPIWQNDLKSIGVNIQIQNSDAAAFTNLIRTPDYNAIYAAQSGDAGMGTPIILFTLNKSNWGGDGTTSTGFNSPRHEELVARGSVELDPERSRAIYREINELLLDESFNVTPAPVSPRLAAIAKVKGITTNVVETYRFDRAWMA